MQGTVWSEARASPCARQWVLTHCMPICMVVAQFIQHMRAPHTPPCRPTTRYDLMACDHRQSCGSPRMRHAASQPGHNTCPTVAIARVSARVPPHGVAVLAIASTLPRSYRRPPYSPRRRCTDSPVESAHASCVPQRVHSRRVGGGARGSARQRGGYSCSGSGFLARRPRQRRAQLTPVTELRSVIRHPCAYTMYTPHLDTTPAPWSMDGVHGVLH